jgi:uncharacterized protein
MSAHEFTIPIADLDAGGRAVTFPVRAAWLRGALEDSDAKAGSQDGSLQVRVSKSGNDVVVHGQLKADLALECARCLAPVALHIDQPLTALMVPAGEMRSRGKDDDGDLENEDLDVVAYSGDTLVLDDLVRDELVLEIPMIPLCSEDCPGISPPPPQDAAGSEHQAIDPRLAPLLRLKKMTEKKE